MSMINSLIEMLHALLEFMANLLKGGFLLMFDLIASVLIILFLLELIKWIKRH